MAPPKDPKPANDTPTWLWSPQYRTVKPLALRTITASVLCLEQIPSGYFVHNILLNSGYTIAVILQWSGSHAR